MTLHPLRRASDRIDIDRVLAGGGEMGRLLREVDWARTPLGPVERWPQSLRTTLSILLTSRHPMFLWWGPELIQFFNDGYRPSLGKGRDLAAIAARGKEFWVEIWPVIGPLVDGVMNEGRSHWAEDQLIPITRDGFLHEVFWTFSYSPIRDESGGVGGTLVVCSETTPRVLGQRRVHALRDLATHTTQAGTEAQACEIATRLLASHGADVPFCAVYLLDADGGGTLHGCTLPDPSALAPLHLDPGSATWPIAEALEGRRPLPVTDVQSRFPGFTAGPWPEPITTAVVAPIHRPGQHVASGFLVAGVSPRLDLDEDYLSFMGLLADQLGSAVLHGGARADERRAAVLKDEFLAMLGHELRNPLAAISAALDLMRRSGDDPTRVEKLRETCSHQVGNLVRLVDDLLDVSRITRGKVELRTDVVDLRTVVENTLHAAKPQVEARKHRLLTALEPGTFLVVADATRLEQVVANLLSNAVRYTEPGGTISVSLGGETTALGRWGVLRVRDDGRGIAADMLQRIFEPFVQVGVSLDRNAGGLGIGLTLVRRLVELHGGSVHVDSAGTGKGSEFTIRLPLTDAAGPARAESSAAPATTGRRILLVEDSLDVREMLKELLEDDGHQVSVAGTGPEALALLLALQPDVALIDVGLPGIDGYEVARQARASPQGKDLFLVALTGYGGREAVARSKQSGFDLHLVKPIDLALLTRVLARRR